MTKRREVVLKRNTHAAPRFVINSLLGLIAITYDGSRRLGVRRASRGAAGRLGRERTRLLAEAEGRGVALLAHLQHHLHRGVVAPGGAGQRTSTSRSVSPGTLSEGVSAPAAAGAIATSSPMAAGSAAAPLGSAGSPFRPRLR